MGEIQNELIFSLIISSALAIFFIYAGRKIKAADPTARPKGVVLVVETGIQAIYGHMQSIMPKKFEKNYYPYFSMLFVWLVIANISGLIGFDAPTSNFSITLALSIITFVLIQYNAIKKQGLGSFIWVKIMPPTELLGMISPLISLSMRLFGNILSGSILMYLVYSLTGWLSSFIIDFNFLGPIVAPLLHCYFDLFAGCSQTLVFVTLSSIFIMMENPD